MVSALSQVRVWIYSIRNSFCWIESQFYYINAMLDRTWKSSRLLVGRINKISSFSHYLLYALRRKWQASWCGRYPVFLSRSCSLLDWHYRIQPPGIPDLDCPINEFLFCMFEPNLKDSNSISLFIHKSSPDSSIYPRISKWILSMASWGTHEWQNPLHIIGITIFKNLFS